MISLAQAPKIEVAKSIRGESHLTSDDCRTDTQVAPWNISTFLSPYRIINTRLIIFSVHTGENLTSLEVEEEMLIVLSKTCSIFINPKYFMEKNPAAQATYS